MIYEGGPADPKTDEPVREDGLSTAPVEFVLVDLNIVDLPWQIQFANSETPGSRAANSLPSPAKITYRRRKHACC